MRIERAVDELLSTYEPRTPDEQADLERVRKLLPAGDPWDRSTPLHLTGSALIVQPTTRKVLLRWHNRQQAWLQVGGHGDPGETDPLAIAIREGYEETGLADLTPWPTAALVHLVVVRVPAAKQEPAHEHADLRFVLATEQPDAIRPEHADAELRWLTMDQAYDLTSEPNLRETLHRVDELFRP